MKKLLFTTALSFLLVFLFSAHVKAANPWPAGTGTDIATNLSAGYEPSGLAWHSRLNTLFVVGDDGDVTEMTETGSILHSWSYGSAFDLEGIAVANPDSNYIYLGREDNRVIYEFDIVSWSLTGKSWDLSSWMTGAVNSGLEALTFVPNGDHPYANSASGGLFYAGHQGDGLIYIFDINLSASGSVSFIGTITPQVGITDLSGLDYVASTKILYAIFDSSDLLLEMQASGAVLNSYVLAGSDQEGIAVKPSCPNTTTNIFIAQDNHPIYSYSNYPFYYQNCAEVIEEQERIQEEENLIKSDKVILESALNKYTLTGQDLIIYFKNLPSELTKDKNYWIKFKEYNKHPPLWSNKKLKSLKRYWKFETNLKNYKPSDSSQKFQIRITFKYNKKIYNNLKKKNKSIKKSDLKIKYKTKKSNWQRLEKLWKKVKIEHNKSKRQFIVKYFNKFPKTTYYFGIGINPKK